MNSIAIRELARIQSLLHVLKTQRDTLSELADIQAFRGLVSTVPKPVESCRFENHGFAVFLGAFSSGLSASVSSFFRFSSRLP
jgi:hypothetical protein